MGNKNSAINRPSDNFLARSQRRHSEATRSVQSINSKPDIKNSTSKLIAAQSQSSKMVSFNKNLC